MEVLKGVNMTGEVVLILGKPEKLFHGFEDRDILTFLRDKLKELLTLRGYSVEINRIALYGFWWYMKGGNHNYSVHELTNIGSSVQKAIDEAINEVLKDF